MCLVDIRLFHETMTPELCLLGHCCVVVSGYYRSGKMEAPDTMPGYAVGENAWVCGEFHASRVCRKFS